MSTNHASRVGSWIAALLLMGGVCAAGEPWRVVEQPELKQALADAPLLKTESLG
jgi:hypothetical protein